MSKTNFNYEEDIKINEDDLDVEWLEQSDLMLTYAQYEADCRKRVNECKENLDVVKADLDKTIRSNPEGFGISKITESTVLNTIMQRTEYKTANAELIEAEYDLGYARAAVEAMRNRKSALENLVMLHGQQYFAGPKVPRNLKSQREQKQKDSNAKVGKHLKRNSSSEEQ